jgi:hypothetical protein
VGPERASESPQLCPYFIKKETLQRSRRKCLHTYQEPQHERDLVSVPMLKKPALTEAQMAARLKFAQDYLERTRADWRKVIWSDESRFCLFGNDGPRRKWVYNKDQREHRQKKTVNPQAGKSKKKKFGGGSIMVWGCFSGRGVGKLEYIQGNTFKVIWIQLVILKF